MSVVILKQTASLVYHHSLETAQVSAITCDTRSLRARSTKLKLLSAELPEGLDP